jgi:hypothetical protein
MTKKLIVTGIMGRFPVGGPAWCVLHYIAGAQRLGYDVFYLEDTGECGFDPTVNGISKDPSYAIRSIRRTLALVGLDDAWAYVDWKRRYHGKTRQEVAKICREADLLLNLSGGCWFSPSGWSARPEYEPVKKVFIDTDPGFTQQMIAEEKSSRFLDYFGAHDLLFTFALGVGSATCRLADTPFRWHPTIQPLALEFWPFVPAAADAPYTAILSWQTESFPGVGKGKAADLVRMIDLPAKSRRRIRLAMGGLPPRGLLSRHGWEVTDAVAATGDPIAYRKFIQESKAELGFAKAMYVETGSGWFSDRTECYLASGRPALVRDTGFGELLPTGEGLLTFADEEDVLAGMDEIERDYERHSRRAREVAEDCFAADRVVRSVLERAGVL